MELKPFFGQVKYEEPARVKSSARYFPEPPIVVLSFVLLHSSIVFAFLKI